MLFRSVQLRLRAFDLASLVEVGTRVRDIFAAGAKRPERVRAVADEELLRSLAA